MAPDDGPRHARDLDRPSRHRRGLAGRALAYARPEHEAILRSVGVQPGWHVLDAGCGTGPHLPLLADLVGPAGRLTAVDLTPENVAAAEARRARHGPACPVEVRVASLDALPFADATFDAVWVANALMYFTDEHLPAVLAELRRVLRPDGLAAFKETDITVTGFYPMDPRHWNPVREGLPSVLPGVMRARGLCHWVRRAGFRDVEQRTVLSERWAPLTPPQRRFIAESLEHFAAVAASVAMDDDTRAYWAAQRDPANPASLVNRPDFAHAEGHCVVRGWA